MKNIAHCFRSTGIIFISLLSLTLSHNLNAVPSEILISGEFDRHTLQFKGSATFHMITSDTPNCLYFHLPANRYHGNDQRSEFRVETQDGRIRHYSRAQLGALKAYRPENLNLSQKISIDTVSINGHFVPFRLNDNNQMFPGNRIDDTLLAVDLREQQIVAGSSFTLTVYFRTALKTLPKGFNAILWDFAPRPVLLVNSHLDFRDQYTRPYKIITDISVFDSSKEAEKTVRQSTTISSVPTFIAGDDYLESDLFRFYPGGYLKDDTHFLVSRIKTVHEFMILNGWIKRSASTTQFAIWDGPLTVSGDHILLPRHLFRYHPVYYKQFEVSLIKGLVEASLQQHYIINKHENLWILPGIYGEIVRSYLRSVYGSNIRLFPWGNWLNPTFQQENTLKKWLTSPGESRLISPDASKINQLNPAVFHPWYEKGFHLLTAIKKSDLADHSTITDSLKEVLTIESTTPPLLDPIAFFDALNFTDTQRKTAALWLSEEGKIDYGIADVKISKAERGYRIEVDIADFGTVSPDFELGFLFNDGTWHKKEVTAGASLYEHYFEKKPVQIIIDPNFDLLEESLLNNSWYLPYKIRPIWDFPAPDRWVITVMPVINGNTFDRNLFGLSLRFKYLNKTELSISSWRSEGDDKSLWESSLTHHGIPWLGSALTIASSELNASSAKTLTFTHRFFDIHDDLWVSLRVSDEKLDTPSNEDSRENATWQSVQSTLSFPTYDGGFSNSTVVYAHEYGQSFDDATSDYTKQSLHSSSIWYIGNSRILFNLIADHSDGVVPLQKKYPMGGPEGIPGFPRESELLFEQRRIVELGLIPPPLATHTNINLLQLGWLDRIEPGVFLHWGLGYDNAQQEINIFKDIELRISGFAKWLNMYQGGGALSIAKPIDNERYKDYRIIFLSHWVF